jgi:hypothetical protein
MRLRVFINTLRSLRILTVQESELTVGIHILEIYEIRLERHHKDLGQIPKISLGNDSKVAISGLKYLPKPILTDYAVQPRLEKGNFGAVHKPRRRAETNTYVMKICILESGVRV